MQNHIVLQSVVGDLLQILLFRSIELTGHDQAPVFGRMLPLVDLPGIEQQVQPLVVPNQTEKERIAFRRIQFEADAGLRTINDDTEIFEKRMRREKRRNLRISAQFAVHLLGHIDKAVHRPQEIAVERLVSHMAFMRFDVVDLTKDTRRTVLFGKTGDRTETGRHKGGPVFHQHEIRLLAGDPPPHGDPVERIHRIHAPHDVQIGRRRCLHRLIPSGKENTGILERESLDLHLVAPALENPGHALHNYGQAPSIRMGGPHDRNFHIPNFILKIKSNPRTDSNLRYGPSVFEKRRTAVLVKIQIPYRILQQGDNDNRFGRNCPNRFRYPSYFVLLYASTPLFRKSMYASTSRL